MRIHGGIPRRATVPALLVLGVSMLAMPADAALFGLDFSNGAGTSLGSFEAPLGGGPVSNLTATISGVLFDTRLPGTTTFDYDPAINEFVYAGMFPSFTNSVFYPICAPGECLLEIYPDPDPLVPGDYLAIDKDLNNIDDGTKYIILPPTTVPLPAGLGLLAAGLAVLRLVAGRRPAG